MRAVGEGMAEALNHGRRDFDPFIDHHIIKVVDDETLDDEVDRTIRQVIEGVYKAVEAAICAEANDDEALDGAIDRAIAEGTTDRG